MTAPSHFYTSRHSFQRRTEGTIVWAFRLATYVILLCGVFVIGNICLKGLPTVTGSFRSLKQFPYVTNTFLFEAPESLYIFKHEGVKREMGDTEYRAFREAETARATAEGRPVPDFKAQSYVYAAGGIWPCIVGTVLLVVGAMTIALLLGVASAIFLSEYARDSAFVRFIRLAIGELSMDATLEEELVHARRRDFLAINPAGTIPVLVEHDGQVVPEASIIAEYLDETRGLALAERRLLPDHAVHRQLPGRQAGQLHRFRR
jgi:hypothetical protein